MDNAPNNSFFKDIKQEEINIINDKMLDRKNILIYIEIIIH